MSTKSCWWCGGEEDVQAMRVRVHYANYEFYDDPDMGSSIQTHPLCKKCRDKIEAKDKAEAKTKP